MGRLIRLPRCIGLSLALAAPTLLPTAAWAQEESTDPADEARARELYDNGVVLYEEGRYEDAIAAWQAAYDLSGRALLLFNIANAWERIGDYQAAIDSLSRYRAFAPADEKELLNRRVRNLERRIEQRSETIVERPEPEPLPAPEPTEETAAVTSDAPLASWVLVGLGGGSLGLAGGMGLAARGTGQQIRTACTDGAEGLLCPESADELIRRRNSQALLADLGLVAGLAGLGVGAALLLRPSPEALQLRPVLGLQQAGVRLDAPF